MSASLRYKIHLSFDGTSYAGWQIQRGQHTVQGELQTIVQQIFQQPVEITGCGRTDAGVHAGDFFAHMDVPDDRFSPDQLVYKINTMSSPQIAIHSAKPQADFHARFDAVSRKYIYSLHLAKDPFLHRYSAYFPPMKDLNRSLLEAAAASLMDYDDFATFCKSGSDVNTTLCEIFESRWDFSHPGKMFFHIRANRFLRGMVRLIVGSNILIAQGKLTLNDLKSAMDQTVRLKKDWSAPPHGLSLVHVAYPGDTF